MTEAVRLGGSLDSRAFRDGLTTPSDLGRDSAEGSVSLDLPITRRSAKIGRLTANAMPA